MSRGERTDILQAPVRNFENREAVTELPETNKDGEPYRALMCTCGRYINRDMGFESFTCDPCGRRFVWGKISDLAAPPTFQRK